MHENVRTLISIFIYEAVLPFFSYRRRDETKELDMVTRWRVARDCLAKFILMVRRGYRDPPYHNWVHGFTVAHSACLLLHNSSLLERGVISDLYSSEGLQHPGEPQQEGIHRVPGHYQEYS